MSYDITSSGNERIKALVRLRDRVERDRTGLFLVEGPRLYARALASGLTPLVTYVGEGDVETLGEVVRVEPSVLDKASYRKRSEGIIGMFHHFETGLNRIELPADPLLLVVEDIEKPGNLGAMMRTAAAAGADALMTVGGTVDPFNPNVVRSSTGALFTLPLAVSSWEEMIPWLEDHGIGVVAASPDGDVSLWDADLQGPVALVIGAEDAGLSEQAAAIARELVVIPQTDRGVDSLNASVAAAVVLFEAVRQRRV
ncbi:MAG: RNA methyltransferase [Acidimicrobiia bacterium]